MKIHFCSSENPVAKMAFANLTQRYGQTEDLAEASVVVSLGGDGTTLGIIKQCLDAHKPLFGLNYGTLGFLQNAPHDESDLVERIKKAEQFTLSALRADITFMDGTVREMFAVNEVFVFNRRRSQTVHLKIAIDGKTYAPLLEGDGLIVATAVGSSGYNYSAGGSVVPLQRDVMTVTPNNQYHHGNKLAPYVFDPCAVDIEVVCPQFREAGVTVDTDEITAPVRHVRVSLDATKKFRLLFDPGYNLAERAMRTQIATATMG